MSQMPEGWSYNVFLFGRVKNRRQFGLPRGTRFALCIENFSLDTRGQSYMKLRDWFEKVFSNGTGYNCCVSVGEKITIGAISPDSSLFKWLHNLK